jgi:hypothetical protein
LTSSFLFNSSRKRRTSYTQDEREYLLDGDDMDECNAALVLMSLSCSPNSPRQGESCYFYFFLVNTGNENCLFAMEIEHISPSKLP